MAESLPMLRRSLERSHPGDSIVRKLYALLAWGHRYLNQPAEALSVVNTGRRLYPEDSELLFHDAVTRHALRDFEGAERSLLTLLQPPAKTDYFASVDVGLRGHKARHYLANLYRDWGRLAEAEAQWRTALAENPDFLAGWIALVELYLKQQRLTAAEVALGQMEQTFPDAHEIPLTRARVRLAQGDFTQARTALIDIVEKLPDALAPRIFLSHVYLQEGQDWPAAEQAIRDVLRLDPANVEAQHNLSLLLGRQAG